MMKKENEVLQAAQDGNLAKLESLFEQRQSKVFAGFFKGPNINWRNENGCTALHLAALNGHEEAVIFLLHNDASANTPDNAGSFPLHLAAFNGHAGVARILIERGPSKARVNEQNMTGDTALHVAAQYNHHVAMDVLLKHHADIFLRNAKEETALDLAAQYGKFCAVQMLIFKDITIIKDSVPKHSPLHLAARNGHLKVVRLLLDSGMPIDAVCDMGTALHTAALFGKVEVAKLLLKRGIDIEIENYNNEKVLDLLCKTPSKISQQITALIYEHSGLASDDNKSETSIRLRADSVPNKKVLASYDFVPGFYNKAKTDDGDIGAGGSLGTYPYVRVEAIGSTGDRLSNYSREMDLTTLTGKKEQNDTYCLVGSSRNYKQLEFPSKGIYDKTPTNKEMIDNPTHTDADDLYVTLDESCKITKKNPNNLLYDVPPNFRGKGESQIPVNESRNSHNSELDNEQQAMLTDAANNLLGIKPLSKSVPINIGTQNFNVSVYKENQLDNNIISRNTPPQRNLSSYDNVNLRSTLKQNTTTEIFESYDNVKLSNTGLPSSYDNVQLKNIPATMSNKDKTDKKKEKSIKQKRTIIKRDIIIDDEFPSDNRGHSIVTEMEHTSKLLNSTITDPSVKTDVPLTETPVPMQRKKVKQARTSSRNVQTGYRMSEVQPGTLDESYEWNKIDKFVSELELFAEEGSPKEDKVHELKLENISVWLNSLGLIQYEPMLISNGFDDIAFLNGVLNDKDLIQLGIVDSEHRKKLVEASLSLPKSPVVGDRGFPFPKDISEWLSMLKLLDYERRFIHYGYDNMERIRVIWELELVSVLEITMIGHCKRMLCSLGGLSRRTKDVASRGQKLSDSSAKKMDTFIDDSMDVAKQLWETAESLKVERHHRLSISKNKRNEESCPNQIIQGKDGVEDLQPVSQDPEKLPNIDWIHSSETLLHSSVLYTMQYLGSHPVHEVKGVASTYNACSKMKIISKNIHKMPSISLSISVRGIDYIDSNSKMIISQYAINNISYCAQDPDDLNIFAYITRDEVTRKHYCHVLKVSSVELADEIIITIGQCFELAYQIYLDSMNNIKQKHALNVGSSPQIPEQTSSLVTPTDRVHPPQPKPFTGEIEL